MATAAASRLSGPVLSVPSYRSSSPTRVKLTAARSPGKSVSVSSPKASPVAARSRKACMCSPTNHPGSFRCSLHKERKQVVPSGHGHSKPASPPSPSSSPASSGACSLGAKRMGSTQVRVGSAVESGTWARRALAPSPQQRRPAGGFRPRPSRLSGVSFAGAGDNRQ